MCLRCGSSELSSANAVIIYVTLQTVETSLRTEPYRMYRMSLRQHSVDLSAATFLREQLTGSVDDSWQLQTYRTDRQHTGSRRINAVTRCRRESLATHSTADISTQACIHLTTLGYRYHSVLCFIAFVKLILQMTFPFTLIWVTRG